MYDPSKDLKYFFAGFLVHCFYNRIESKKKFWIMLTFIKVIQAKS